MLNSGIRRGGSTRRAGLVAAVASLLALAGCASVVDGHPDVVRRPVIASPAAPTAAQLHALLMPAPTGSKGWGDSWGNTAYPTVRQFVTRQYPAENVSTVIDELTHEGVTSITHRAWIATNGTQADIVLFAFATDAGAADRYQVASASQGENAGVVTVPFSASHEAAAYRHSAADDDGYITGIVYSFSGPVVAEVFTYTPNKRFDSTSTGSWARSQIARI